MATNDTNDLIAQVKRRIFVPTNQATYQSSDFAALFNDAMREWLVPAIRKVRENYFQAKTDVAITGSQSDYPVPSRAMGAALRFIQYVYNNGTAYRPLAQLQLQDVQNIATNATGLPQGFYWNGNIFTIYPTPSFTNGDLARLFYFLRPNTIVTPDQVGIISSVNGLAVTLASSPPAGFSSGALYDIVQASPPFGTLTMDNPASISGSVLTFTNALPTVPWAPAVGDQVCLAQQAAVAQVPLELQGALVQRVTVKVAEGVGDTELLAAHKAELDRMERDIPIHITPRSEGNAKKAVNRVWGV